MRVTLVVGARPNFMKVAPVLKALSGRPGVAVRLVHTGQHYDEKMSDSFLRELSQPFCSTILILRLFSWEILAACFLDTYWLFFL